MQFLSTATPREALRSTIPLSSLVFGALLARLLAAERAIFAVLIEKGTLRSAGSCEFPVFFTPNLNGNAKHSDSKHYCGDEGEFE